MVFMDGLDERLRRFFKLTKARAEKSYEYWKRVPVHRMGDEFYTRIQKLMEAMMTGKGDVYALAAETSFVLMLLCEKYPQIREILDNNRASIAAQVEREGAVEETKSNESWRG